MLYYVLGLLTSTLVFSFFLSALRAPVSSQYLWMVLFSLTFLSGAAMLVFLVGLVARMAHEARQRNQAAGRVSLPDNTLLAQSDLARRWPWRRGATDGEIKRDMMRYGEPIPHRLRGDTHEATPRNTKPGASLLPGFESIKRH